MSKTNKRRKHADLIKAWADGAIIQCLDLKTKEWFDVGGNFPTWSDECEYRIKPEADEPWKPKDGGSYLFVNSCGDVDEKIWESNKIDEKRYENGNCFHLQSDAEAVAEQVKAAMKGLLKISAPNAENFQLDDKPITKGEKALIRAMREVKVRGVFAEDSYLTYIDDDGKLNSTGGVVAFDVSIFTMKHNEQVRAALKQIRAEQEASNEA